MILAQHPALPAWVLLWLYIGGSTPVAFLMSLVALRLVLIGRRKARSTRFFAIGSLLLILPAALGMLYFWSMPTQQSPLQPHFNIVWVLMLAISLPFSIYASLAATS